MTSNPPHEPMSGHLRYGKKIMRATRYSTNHNWCYRGDNTKYRSKK